MKGRTRRAAGASLAVSGLLALTPAAHAAAGVSVTSLSSLKGSAGTLTGVVANETSRGTSANITVSLHRGHMKRRIVGHTTVTVPARGRVDYSVAVKLPSGLARGNYYLSACTPFGGPDAGKLGCATGADDIKIKGGTPVRGSKVQLPSLASLAHAAAAEDCTPGARTLVKPGDRVYPEAGNGGYKSVHTDVFTVYDAVTNLFLAGTHVDLTQRSTQCLSEFSVDFDAHNTVSGTASAPSTDMTVQSITINGTPATFTYKQPTYPGDPKGQDDPDPLAHRTGLTIPISATNPNPPACAPQLAVNAGGIDQPCLPTKLVITPAAPIPSGTDFKVTINYTGRPGIRNQGDGRTEGWFRNNTPAADGAMVTSEPMGTMAWMPLNDHTAVKPTYDLHSTVNYDPAAAPEANRVFIGNGRLVSTVVNAPDANYPTGGSRTFNWHSPEPIGAYLVENSVGHFSLTERVATAGDVLYYEAQAANITDARKASNKLIMDTQEDITHFQEQVNGPFPFNSNGIIVALPSASFEEEMQTKIVFVGGQLGSAQTFSHENMHQWWGDNVSYSDHRYTFFKEGYADFSEYLYLARVAGLAAGAAGSAAYNTAFENAIATRFNGRYNSTSGTFWNVAPTNPTSANLFGTPNTYQRPGMTYVALRAIVGKDNFAAAAQQIQREYGGGSISPAQQIVIYKQHMPNQSIGCLTKLDAFFKQYWDTAYTGSPAAGNKPNITGPGLTGPGFYDASGGCSDYATEQPGTPGGTVPATLGLTLGTPAAFPAFTPGAAKSYTASTTATVVSTAADATLSVTDPSATAPGHLVNGAFSLPSALQAKAASPLGTAAAGGALSGAPLTLETWNAPASNDVSTVTFTQAIGASDALRTGSYAKTLTFTLSTTTP